MDQPVGLVVVLNSEIAGDLGTEVVGVGSYSVHAMVRGRNHHGQHLPPPSAERGGAVHQNAIEIQRSLHGGRVGAHDRDNAPDPPGAGHSVVVQLFQQPGGLIRRNNIDIRHGGPPFRQSNQKQLTWMDRMNRIETTKSPIHFSIGAVFLIFHRLHLQFRMPYCGPQEYRYAPLDCGSLAIATPGRRQTCQAIHAVLRC